VVTVNYLPERPVLGIAAAGMASIVYPGEWPDWQSVRFVLMEGDTAATSDGEIRFAVPKGRTQVVKLSSTIAPNYQDHFAVTTSLPSRRAPRLSEGAEVGVTPSLSITCVHAVEQPLRPPELKRSGAGPQATRARGGTEFVPSADLIVDRPSTGLVYFEATWSGWLDDPQRSAPHRVGEVAGHPPGDEPAVELLVPSVRVPLADDGQAEDEKVPMLSWSVDLEESRHRMITFTPHAITRFTDCFPETREMISEEVVPERFRVEGPRFEVDVPSSEPPPAVDFAYALPTFSWEETATAGRHATVTRTRRARGLRIHFHRPWFASGDDERLAVLVARTAPTGETPDNLSSIASDPIRTGDAPVSSALSAANLDAAEPGTAERWTNNQLDTCDAVLFEIDPERDYDEASQLWSVEIDVSHSALGTLDTPFVQLAIARCQPHSLMRGFELSETTLTPLCPIASTRSLHVRLEGRRRVFGRKQLRVDVNGRFERFWRLEATRPEANVPTRRELLQALGSVFASDVLGVLGADVVSVDGGLPTGRRSAEFWIDYFERERPDVALDSQPTVVPAFFGGGIDDQSHRIHMRIETTNNRDASAWTQIPAQVRQVRADTTGFSWLLDEPDEINTTYCRVVVEEYERFSTDPTQGVLTHYPDDLSDLGMSSLAERPVYFDHVYLDPRTFAPAPSDPPI
jgi:hypothetical protein